MNTENINIAINVMKRHRDAQHTLHMEEYQLDACIDNVVRVEDELCGTPCCFAGYLGVSPEFIAKGGRVSDCGIPMSDDLVGEECIADFLGITRGRAASLTWLSLEEMAYPHAVDEGVEPTFDEVIEALESLRDKGVLPGE